MNKWISIKNPTLMIERWFSNLFTYFRSRELFGLVTTRRKSTWHTYVIKVGVLNKEGDITREMRSPVGQSLMEARGTEMKDQWLAHCIICLVMTASKPPVH